MQYPNKFRRVVDNIYAGAGPTPDQLRDLKKELNIKYLISLDSSVALKLAPTAASLQIKHVIIPINPGATRIDDNLKYLARNIVRLLTNFQPVYIHCLQGQDRTGLAIAIFRILKYKYSVPQAMTEARKFGYGAGVSIQTQTLWNNLLLSLSQGNSVDNITNNVTEDNSANLDETVVQLQKDWSLTNDLPPAFNPQQSFAPYADIPMKSHDSGNLIQLPEEAVIYDANQIIPIVGGYSNMGPIRGAGPVENSGNLVEIK